jgi:elongation factor 1-gamma
MSLGKLYVYPFEFNANLLKISVMAKYASETVEYMGVDACESEQYYKNCNPLGRHPALETANGSVFESNAIVRYVARVDKTKANLYGQVDNALQASQVDQWLDFSANEVQNHAIKFLYNKFFGAQDEAVLKASTDSLVETFTGLEKWLETRTFLVGDAITAADIVVAITLDMAFRFAPSAAAYEQFAKFANVLKFYQTIWNLPTFQAGLHEKHPKVQAEKPE